MTDSPSASPGAHPAGSSARGIGVVAGFHPALTASLVSASSCPLCCMVTASGHRWFSPPPCLTAISLQALPAFLTVFHLFHLPVLNVFRPVPFPCFSQVSKPSSSESLSCQAAAKALFSLLSLQIDFSATKYPLITILCCLPWAFLLLPLPTLKCISAVCLMSLQQPAGIEAQLLDGSQRQWVWAVLFACLACWEQNPSPLGSSLHLYEVSGKIYLRIY